MNKYSFNLLSMWINILQNWEQPLPVSLMDFFFFFLREVTDWNYFLVSHHRALLRVTAIAYARNLKEFLIFYDMLFTHQLCIAREKDWEGFSSLWVLMQQFTATEFLMDKLSSFPLLGIWHFFKHPLSHAHTHANIHESESTHANIHESESRYIIPLLFS